MIILGLTGSIGMGKTTAATMLQTMGLRICDSDALVHKLLARGGLAVNRIGAEFAGVVRDGVVDRSALGQAVFADPDALKRLEAILHPMVQAAQANFLKSSSLNGVQIAVLDVPLLFEVGTDKRCDAVIVVTAPRFLQEQRVLRRPGMTPERLRATLMRQLPDAEKRRRADFIVHTGLGKWHTYTRLRGIILLLRDKSGTKWPPIGPDSWGRYARSRA
ncbi:dephospho-CoA kinase [Alphaproteobacteria bacterium]|nr:dephospho-CoA kinase [Alphaproteobacteria bacterium]